MRIAPFLFCLLVLLFNGCAGADDDDSTRDDDVAGDDDSSAGDDDDSSAGDDDDSSAGDDDDSSAGDDDDSAVGTDSDGDGVTVEEGDCDDTNANILAVSDKTVNGAGSASYSLEFKGVCAGTFDMGCTIPPSGSACPGDELPVHSVTLTHNLFVGTTEVTQDQWTSLMGNTPDSASSCAGDCPVVNVSQLDALAFANALSTAEGLPECYSLIGCSGVPGTNFSCSSQTVNGGSEYLCTGYRLPTEAEWEYAARGGTDLVYAGSDTADDVAWHDGNSGGAPHDVAGKAANSLGLYDMSGNVWEWTSDLYSSSIYSSSPASDPPGSSFGSQRAYRGGSWDHAADHARVSNRAAMGGAWSVTGFRLVGTSF